jgi:hypothetical protein
MKAELLAAIAGILLSLLFSYVPKFADWYNPLDGTKKRLVMLGLLVLAAGGTFGLSCDKIVQGVTCDMPGAIQLVSAFIFALIANQSTNSISPEVGLKKPSLYEDIDANRLPFT